MNNLPSVIFPQGVQRTAERLRDQAERTDDFERAVALNDAAQALIELMSYITNPHGFRLSDEQ